MDTQSGRCEMAGLHMQGVGGTRARGYDLHALFGNHICGCDEGETTTNVVVPKKGQPHLWSCRREGSHICGRAEESATTFVVKISCKPLISPVCEGIFLLSNHICGCSKEETTTFVVEARKRQPQMWSRCYKDGHKCGRQKTGATTFVAVQGRDVLYSSAFSSLG